MYLIAVFLAKLLSPITILLALVAGASCQQWWQIFLAAAVVALLDQHVLSSIQQTRDFDPLSLLLGMFAAAVWIALVFSIKRYRAARRKNVSN